MQCRVCMQTECRILLDMSVACTEDGKSLFDYFNECTQLQASKNDNFPKTICKICAQKLQIAYNFRKCALESHFMFKTLFESQEIEAESILISTNEIYPTETEEIVNDPLEMKLKDALRTLAKTDLDDLGEQEVERKRKMNDFAKTDLILKEDCFLTENKLDEGLLNREAEENDKDKPIVFVVKNAGTISPVETKMESEEYFCEICQCKYDIKNDLIKHISEQHQSNIMCVDCSKTFDMPDELRTHKKLVHDTDSPVHCDYCKETTLIPRDELVEHLQMKHKSQYFKYFPPTCYKCRYCRSNYSSPLELEEHVKKMHVIFVCANCGKSYGNSSSFRKHLNYKHSKTVTEAKQEIKNQRNEYIISGNVIPKTSKKKSKGELNEKNFYEMQSTLINQVPEESLEKANYPKLKEKTRYLCAFCPRVLCSRSSTEAHERKKHLNIKPVMKECTYCQKEFHVGYIKKHINTVHIAERKFHCDICGDSFKTRGTLTGHRKLHSKERQFPCTVCSKRFAFKSELKVHMRVHTGEMPFTCHLCDQQFRIRVHLTYHLEKHTNIMKKCEICGKEFKNTKSLRNHSYQHGGKMPYSCLVCDYGNPKREDFVKHMLHKHNISMTEPELFAMFKANTGRSPRVKLAEELEEVNEILQPTDLIELIEC